MITIQGKLILTPEESLQIDALMRGYSSCKRYVYQRLLEGKERNELKRDIPALFGINSRYVDDAIMQASCLIKSVQEKGQDPKRVVFGGKSAAGKLAKRHLSHEQRKDQKDRWREKRQGSLYSRGDKSKNGNLNLRVSRQNNQYTLRINLGKERTWIQVPFQTQHKKLSFFNDVLDAGLPYNVQLIKRDDKVYVHLTIEEELPKPKFSFARGAMGVDINAFPAMLAWAEIDTTGNFIDCGTVATPHLYDQRQNKRDTYAWQAAHEIVRIAQERQKGIILENLDFERTPIKKGRKLRRCFSNFSYRKLKDKILILAKRAGIPVKEVHPAHTSMIGALKYAPQFNSSRHTAAAMVIARRGLGFREDIPKSYQKEADAILISPQCKPNEGARVHQGKEEASIKQGNLKNIWSVLWVVVLTGHCIGKMNFSTLKRKLIQGYSGEHGCESHGQDPPLGNGSSVQNEPSADGARICPSVGV